MGDIRLLARWNSALKDSSLDSGLMMIPLIFHVFAGHSQLEARGVFDHGC